ncbi:MAG: hypothetical protein ACOY4R_28160 [Pseudomonadota bacterium]
MKTSIELTHRGRHLTIRAAMIAGDWQVWVHEGGRRIYLYGVLAFDEGDRLAATLEQARRDVETDAIVVPVLRFWPSPQDWPEQQAPAGTAARGPLPAPQARAGSADAPDR